MTRIDFHVNAPDPLGYACRLVRKIYRAGQRVVVCCDDASRLNAFDQALWTFSQLDFIPHVRAGDRLAPRTPVVLVSSDANLPGPDAGTDADADASHEPPGAGVANSNAGLPHHDVLVNLGTQMPPFFSRFDRLIEVVGAGDDERGPARTRFRFYKDRGYPVQTHDLASAEAATR